MIRINFAYINAFTQKQAQTLSRRRRRHRIAIELIFFKSNLLPALWNLSIIQFILFSLFLSVCSLFLCGSAFFLCFLFALFLFALGSMSTPCWAHNCATFSYFSVAFVYFSPLCNILNCQHIFLRYLNANGVVKCWISTKILTQNCSSVSVFRPLRNAFQSL